MLRDIYLRNVDDPKYDPVKIEETDNIEDLVQQLMMLFATSPGEVIAFPDYGINLDDLLFEFELDQEKILEEINFQYSQYIAPRFPGVNIEFELYVSEGDITRIFVLDVYINSKLNFQITN